jgi:hypothetical protein
VGRGSLFPSSARLDRVTKIVSAQANCTFYEALRLLNERSGVEHLTLDEVSAAVLDDSIRFDQ